MTERGRDRSLSEPLSRRVVLSIALAAMAAPLLAGLAGSPQARDTLWLLPVVGVGLVATAWRWPGALAATAFNGLVYITLDVWPADGVLGPAPSSVTERLVVLALSLGVGIAVAWLAIRLSANEQVRRLNERYLRAEDQVRQALSESETRFRGAFDDAGSGIAITSPDGRYLRVNRSLCQLLGYDESELLGMTYRDVTVPEDLDLQEAEAALLQEGRKPSFQIEKRYRRKDGGIVYVVLSLSVIRDSAGEPACYVAHVQDISDRKEAEEALRESEERFRILAAAAPIGIFQTDASGRCVYVNDGWSEITGQSPEASLGAGWFAAFHPDDLERATRAWQAAGADGGDFVLDARFVAQSGDVRYVHVHGAGVFDDAGKRIAVVGAVEDVTDRALSEHELRRREQEFKALAENAPDVIIRYDRELRVTYANPVAARTLGRPAGELLGRPVADISTGPERSAFWTSRIERVLATGEPAEVEYDVPREGGRLWFQARLVPEFDADGGVDSVLLVSHDVTSRKESETALRESEERFRAAVEGSMDTFYVLRAIRDDAGKIIDFEFVDMNARAKEFLRIERAGAIGMPVSALFPAYRETGFFDKYRTVVESGRPFEEELPDETPGFEGTWLRHQIVPLSDGVAVTSRDITERMEIENALRESEERFRSAFAYAVTGMARVAPDGRFLEVNQAFSATFGWDDVEMRARSLTDLAHPDDRPQLLEQIERLVSGASRAIQFEGRFYNRRARLLWGLLGASVVHDRSGAPFYLICQIQDITARKDLEQRLLRQAQHDALTSLPNRRLFRERLDQALLTAGPEGDSIALMYLDLDGFKSVNDNFGHQVGDELLRQVGRRLARCIRGGDTVARIGGDEFAIIVAGFVDPPAVTRIAARVIEEFGRPFVAGSARATVGVSIGIAFTMQREISPEQLIHEADVALYQAKAAGKARFVVYRDDLTPEQEDQLLAERTTDWPAADRTDEGGK